MPEQKLKPLIIDDDDSERTEICAYLRDICEMEPVALKNGEDTLAFLKRQPHGYKVILSDIRLGPGIGGDKLLHLIRKNYPEMEVILMSAYQDYDAVVRAVNEHAYYFLRKPLSDMKLVEKLIRDGAQQSRAKAERRQLIVAFEDWVNGLQKPYGFKLLIGTRTFTPPQLLQEVQNGSDLGEEYLKNLLIMAVDIVAGTFELKEP